jgi:hypothetical protein
MNLTQIFQKGDFRIDLFMKNVCGQLSLSKGIADRARKVFDFKNFEVFFCSNEDIFLFKTMTEREGDLSDCESIARSGILWKVILDEIKDQVKNSKKDIWVTWIGERLDILEERGVNIPILDEINKLREKFFDEFEKTLKK